MKYKYHLDTLYAGAPAEFGEYKLWQTGMLYCNPSNKIKLHVQPRGVYELTVITAGRGEIYTDGMPIAVRTGDIHIAFPEELHEIVSDDADPLRFDFFSFIVDEPVLSAELSRLSESCRAAERRILQSDHVASLVRQGIREINGKEPYYERIMADVIEQIAICIIRTLGEIGGEPTRATVTEADSLCYQAVSYIDTHLFSMKSLTEISDALSYNYSYLSNLFKKTMGQGLMDYYRLKRLETAKYLLLDGKMSVTQVAERLNYSSVYAFSRAFRTQYGESPNKYRRSCEDE